MSTQPTTKLRKNEIKNCFENEGMDDILPQFPVSNLAYFSNVQDQQNYAVVDKDGFSRIDPCFTTVCKHRSL